MVGIMCLSQASPTLFLGQDLSVNLELAKHRYPPIACPALGL